MSEPLRILLVEDSLDDRELIDELLSQSTEVSFDVVHVDSLTAALNLLERESFAAVLLDLNLPDSDGLATFLKAKELIGQMPILVLTGLADESLELRVIRHGGEDFLVKGEFPAGTLIRSLKNAIERTDLREQLQASEEERERLFNVSLDLLCIADLSGYFKRINPSFCRVLGYSEVEMLNTSFVDFIHPDDHEATLAELRKLSTGVDTAQFENRYRAKDGSYRWLQWTSPAPSNGSTTLYAVARDVTEKKRSEVAIHGLHVITSDAKATFDEKIAQLLNLGRERFSLDVAMLGLVDNDRCRVEHIVAPTDFPIQQGAEVELEKTFCDLALKAGEPVAIHQVAGTKLTDHPLYQNTGLETYLGVPIFVDGVAVGTVAFCDRQPRDESFTDAEKDFVQLMARWIGYEFERKRSAENLRQLEADLAHVSRVSTMGEMATVLAHEVNQPLAAIANYASTCVKMGANEQLNHDELKHATSQIYEQARRAGEIVNRLKRFMAKASPKSTWVNANEIVRQVADLMESDVQSRRTSLELRLDECLPVIRADSIQIQQVLVNLLRNALDAMENITPRDRRIIITTASTPDGVRIEVCDYGLGMEPEVVDRLFEPYFTTKTDGLGVGLSISQRIIQAHGGHLTANPNADRGMTFQFTMPVEAEEYKHEAPASE